MDPQILEGIKQIVLGVVGIIFVVAVIIKDRKTNKRIRAMEEARDAFYKRHDGG